MLNIYSCVVSFVNKELTREEHAFTMIKKRADTFRSPNWYGLILSIEKPDSFWSQIIWYLQTNDAPFVLALHWTGQTRAMAPEYSWCKYYIIKPDHPLNLHPIKRVGIFTDRSNSCLACMIDEAGFAVPQGRIGFHGRIDSSCTNPKWYFSIKSFRSSSRACVARCMHGLYKEKKKALHICNSIDP